ncbi:ferrous iron transport protein A [Vibrio sp. DW001]|uniref:FeoA family protein n=1 Tax=Vibrio sp. DW001 TaxID=2912315 RepID=UPI0023AF7EEF|nr:FeoA family protein [Vibrio sp. DW001]WED29443.1 ferrous iron transport protein A [Vibrio sp. DW001]
MLKARTLGYIATLGDGILNQAIFSLMPDKLAKLLQAKNKNINVHRDIKNLSEAKLNKEYEIKNIIPDDKEMVHFLFTLGCFKGESVTVISILSDTYVIAVKDARYSIDLDLAKIVMLI